MVEVESRIKELEDWQRKASVELALVIAGNKEASKKLDNISTNITRLVWLIIASILGGFLTFMMNGGLNNVPS